MSKITIVDSPMGSGKTTWAIQHLINNNPLINQIYITPFLSEIERVTKAAAGHKRFYSPKNIGDGKLTAINKLLSRENSIVATHELFKHLNHESRKYILNSHYTLILDEVLEVVTPYNLRAGDLKVLLDSKWIHIDEDGFVIWNSNEPGWDSTFEEVKMLAENHSLVCVNGKILLWRYPPEIFEMFDQIYILTYLFESSILCAYFKYNNIEYIKKSVRKTTPDNYKIEYKLCDFYKFDASIFARLINIYDGPLNRGISQSPTGLSKSWFANSKNKKKIERLKNNIYNYFRNIIDAKSETIMWTCFKDDISKLKGKGYTNMHIACNCRSTNDYGDRSNLAYVVNRYLNPGIPLYFSKKGIIIDEDLYALSELIQWIWRSRIRNGESINIYVPSVRMRSLLRKRLTNRLPIEQDQ